MAQAVRESSFRKVAEESGVSHTSLFNFVEKGFVPYERTLDRIEKWAERRRTGPPSIREPSPVYGAPEPAAPNYEGLGIDLPGYDRLHEQPRHRFDHFMLELIAMGLGREDLEVLGRGAIAPIAELNTLHKGKDTADTRVEENQMLILDRMIPALLEMARERRR